jgi:hypothetical protein
MQRRATGFLATVLLLVSMGSPEAPSWTGRLAAKGNEPFTFLALVDQSGHQWHLDGPLVKELWRRQGEWVRVTGQAQPSNAILVESWAPVPAEETKP